MSGYFGTRGGYRYGSRSSGPSGAIVAGIIVVLLLVILGGWACVDYNKDVPVTVKITGKESVSTGDGHEYRLYADDEVYVMGDSLLKGRFRTANDYARIKIGRTYNCTAWGWRIPLFSSFKNIRDCQEVER